MDEQTRLTECAETAIAEINSSELTMPARMTAAIRAVVRDTHPMKTVPAIHAIQAFLPYAKECIVRGDEIEGARQIQKLLGQLPELRRAVPEKTAFEKASPQMRGNGWSSAEIDIVKMLSLGKEIGRVTWEGIEIDGQWRTRQAIRLSARAKWSQTGDAEWVRGFGPIREVKSDGAGVKYLANDTLP